MERWLVVAVFALSSGCSGAQRTPWRPRAGATLEQLLNVHRASAPDVSRTGASVVFLSDAPGVPQAFVATPSADGSARPEAAWQRLLAIDDRVQFVRYTPDDRFVFLGRDHGGDENVQLLRINPDGSGLLELTPTPGVKNLFGPIADDSRSFAYASNERSRGDFDVYLREVSGAPAREVFEGHGHFEPVALSPDGTKLIVSEVRSNFDNDLHLVDVATGQARALTAHTGDVRFESVSFRKDGASLFLVTDKDSDRMEPAELRVNVTTPVVERLRPPMEHDVDDLEVSPVGDVAAIGVNLDGWTEVQFIPARRELSEPARTAALPRMVTSGMRFSQDGRWLVVGGSRASVPDEIYRVEVATGRSERITTSDHAGLDEATLVEPTVERLASFDGVSIPVLTYRPKTVAAGERLPVVVWVHGGPESQATPNFNPVIQFLVGHGYLVVAPNVRGSTGYGNAYAHLDDVARREDSVHDLAEVNRWLRARPDVNPEAIAVMGGSYGGYMTLAAITLYPALWAAACDIVGISNFRTFLENTAPYRRALREAEYGSLARDGALLDQLSPIHRVAAITAPLFVIHGTNDPRVPVSEAEQIVTALRARGQRVEYLRFENEGHGLSRRENRVRAYTELVRFFDAVLSGPPAHTPPGTP